MDAVFGTLLIRFFMIVCSLILITRTISGHMYELSVIIAGTNEQSGKYSYRYTGRISLT